MATVNTVMVYKRSKKALIVLEAMFKAQFLVEAIKLGVIPPKLVFKKLPLGTTGEHTPGLVKVDLRQHGKAHDLDITIRHELRHEWQYKKYPSIYAWVDKHIEEYNEGKDLYKYSLIEMDARLYAATGEGLERYFEELSEEDFDSMYKDGTLIPTMKKIAELYQVP